MQGYMYSVFSCVAIAIHLIINFDLLTGRWEGTAHGVRYREFLMGILAYYITDAAWGVLAGLGWNGALYVETAFFFLALVAFVFMWSRFAIVYLNLDKWATRIISWYGYALLAFNIVALAANPFCNCFYHIDAQGIYKTGCLRDPAFFLLVAFNVLTAVFVLAKALGSRDSVRRRSMMVFLYCVTMTAAMILQVVWPLTPFTALGCLVGNCFFHVFVIQDEQAARHAAELEKALERARSAEKARSMFFSSVSHDIRTPLNAILGYSEILQKSVVSQSEREEALDSIRTNGMTLLHLVNDILGLAGMDSGGLTLRPEPVRLDRMTDEVFASFKLVAAGKDIELVNRAEGVPAVMLDGDRFRQILFNLIGNAVKFTERGTVSVFAFYSGTNLEVSVSDTGCGIAPDMLTRIVDPFVQVQDPSHALDRAGGMGLGLSICRRLVETMGGELVAESELGKGSKFRVVLPGVEAAGEEVVGNSCSCRKDKDGSDSALQLQLQTTTKSTPTPTQNSNSNSDFNSNPRHVLVIDDSPVNRKVLTAFLKKAGIASIEQAGDGGEALATLGSAVESGNPCDFVFSDLWMPNMNGLELIEKIRADSRFVGLPVFAVTADTEVDHDARSALFTGILLKPVTYAKLVEAFTTTMR